MSYQGNQQATCDTCGTIIRAGPGQSSVTYAADKADWDWYSFGIKDKVWHACPHCKPLKSPDGLSPEEWSKRSVLTAAEAGRGK